MTDGVSDPLFEAYNDQISIPPYNALWKDLTNPGETNLLNEEAPHERILDWLDFWSPGNNDDRTIAILY